MKTEVRLKRVAAVIGAFVPAVLLMLSLSAHGTIVGQRARECFENRIVNGLVQIIEQGI